MSSPGLRFGVRFSGGRLFVSYCIKGVIMEDLKNGYRKLGNGYERCPCCGRIDCKMMHEKDDMESESEDKSEPGEE